MQQTLLTSSAAPSSSQSAVVVPSSIEILELRLWNSICFVFCFILNLERKKRTWGVGGNPPCHDDTMEWNTVWNSVSFMWLLHWNYLLQAKSLPLTFLTWFSKLLARSLHPPLTKCLDSSATQSSAFNEKWSQRTSRCELHTLFIPSKKSSLEKWKLRDLRVF